MEDPRVCETHAYRAFGQHVWHDIVCSVGISQAFDDGAAGQVATMYLPSPGATAQQDPREAALQIRVLGEFGFELNGHAVATAAWQRSHARRLIQLLCSAPRLTETRSRLLSVLWPDSDEAHARNRLHHTVHCIRKAWEEIPADLRPKMEVTSERVVLTPGPDTVIDLQVFVQGVEADCTQADERLACLEQALSHYAGSLAQGWDDCSEIQTRRAWLEKLQEQALHEAVATALELEQPAVALRHARQLAQQLQTDCEAHCQYARLLADNNRPDAALLHCQDVRAGLEAEDPGSLPLLDETVHAIQQRANRRAPVVDAAHIDVASAAPSAASASVSAAVAALAITTQALPRLPLLPAPTRQPVGYATVSALCRQCVEDPFGAITSLVGPPGAGKSLLAASLAHSAQGAMQHGALWLDCTDVTDTACLLTVIAKGLKPLGGAVPATDAGVAAALQGKELLIVLDGLNGDASLVGLAHVVGLASRDTRWLITSWSARHVRGERIVTLDHSLLLQTPADAGSVAPSHAAQILLSSAAQTWRLQDARSIQVIEQICAALDGLPLSLEIAGQCLSTMSPNELATRLQRDDCALLRDAQRGADSADTLERRLAQAVGTWASHAQPRARQMLTLLGRCRSWLTREDIECLMGDTDGHSTQTLVEHCVRHHFLLRRTHAAAHAPRSEFRVPRIVTAALRLFFEAADPAWADERLRFWLQCGHDFVQTEADNRAAAVAAWFDEHLCDLDAAADSWIESGQLTEVATLCRAHAAHGLLPRHTTPLHRWLEALGESMAELPPQLAVELLIVRARMRAHRGELGPSCDDASRALTRLTAPSHDKLREEALQLLQRYGVPEPTRTQHPNTMCRRGVDAGESLMRISQLAVRHGQLVEAQTLCGQAVEVFGYFGLGHALAKAHRFHAKIAFALGNPEQAMRSLGQAQRVAQSHEDSGEALLSGFMKAELLTSQMQFAQAIELASQLIAQPECAQNTVLGARATLVVAWAHYGQGAYPLAHALCHDLRQQATDARGMALQINAEILSALTEARCHRPALALRSASAVLELLTHHQPLPDEQNNLVNAAELAMCLNRADLAAPMLGALNDFSQRPQHRLRAWTSARISALQKIETPLLQDRERAANMSSYADVLSTLVAS
jgi:DNA-binding SARP family transcriptional activator